MIFQSENKNITVSISHACLMEMLEYVKLAGRYETGGILIGKYSEDHLSAEIEQITGPSVDSKSGFTWFTRGVKGLKFLLSKHWNAGRYYLGEWHYHPGASPEPSWQDIRQMKKIAHSKNYNCPEPVLIIIGGTWEEYEIRTFIHPNSGSIVNLKLK